MATDATLNKYANELLNLYIKLWSEKYKEAPILNRHRIKWAFKDMYEDLGTAQSKAVIEYYFRTSRMGHPVQYLIYNYDKLYKIIKELEKDEEDRKKWREETKARVLAAEKKKEENGNQ